MTISVRIVSSDPGQGKRNGVINSTENQISAFTKVLDGTDGPDQEQPLTRQPPSPPGLADRPARLVGRYRFADTEDASAIVGAVRDAVTRGPPLDWWLIQTHNCDHSLKAGSGGGGCPDDTVGELPDGSDAEVGAVPEVVR